MSASFPRLGRSPWWWTSSSTVGVEDRSGALTARGHHPQAGLGDQLAHLRRAGSGGAAGGVSAAARVPSAQPLEDLDDHLGQRARRGDAWPGARARPTSRSSSAPTTSPAEQYARKVLTSKTSSPRRARLARMPARACTTSAGLDQVVDRVVEAGDEIERRRSAATAGRRRRGRPPRPARLLGRAPRHRRRQVARGDLDSRRRGAPGSCCPSRRPRRAPAARAGRGRARGARARPASARGRSPRSAGRRRRPAPRRGRRGARRWARENEPRQCTESFIDYDCWREMTHRGSVGTGPVSWDWGWVRTTCWEEARRVLGPSAAAEDAAQEAAIKAWRHHASCSHARAPASMARGDRPPRGVPAARTAARRVAGHRGRALRGGQPTRAVALAVDVRRALAELSYSDRCCCWRALGGPVATEAANLSECPTARPRFAPPPPRTSAPDAASHEAAIRRRMSRCDLSDSRQKSATSPRYARRHG